MIGNGTYSKQVVGNISLSLGANLCHFDKLLFELIWNVLVEQLL